MLKKEIVRNNWVARKAPKGFQMKNNFFVLGLLSLTLASALIFAGCPTPTYTPTGNYYIGNNDPKTLVITGIPSDLLEAMQVKYNYAGRIYLSPIGTRYGQIKGDEPGANLLSPEIIIRGSGPYTITIPLYDNKGRWNGSGSFDVYLAVWTSDYSRYYRADSIEISSEITTVPFSKATAWKIEFELEQDGFKRFSTNDPREYDSSWWRLYGNGYDNTYEIDCKKMNGAYNYGYGMLFGASNTDARRYYLLLITTDGDYSIGKFSNDKYTIIKDWAKSEKLNTGYNTINTLKVVKNGTTFTVYLNGSQVHQFTDTEISGDRFGYGVSIGSKNDEAFPDMPLDVRFRQK